MMKLHTESTLLRGVTAGVVLLLCLTMAGPVAAMNLDGHGESFSPLQTVLSWLGLAGVTEIMVGWVPEEQPTFEKEGGTMDPNGVYGADDGHAAPEWPSAAAGTGGG